MSNENNDSFFQEVDEGIRRDQWTAIAKRYGPWAIGAAVVLIVGTLAWDGLRGMQGSASSEAATAFAAAQEQARSGEIEEAQTALAEMTDSGPQVYRALARMERAAILEQQGDLQAALAEFDAAAEAARDPLVKNTARLRAAYLVADTQDFQAVQARLQPIIDDGGAMSFLARELLAVEAWEAGQNDLARDTLNTLTLAFDAPESVRQRAQLALAVLGRGEAPAAPAAPAPAQETSSGEPK